MTDILTAYRSLLTSSKAKHTKDTQYLYPKVILLVSTYDPTMAMAFLEYLKKLASQLQLHTIPWEIVTLRTTSQRLPKTLCDIESFLWKHYTNQQAYLLLCPSDSYQSTETMQRLAHYFSVVGSDVEIMELTEEVAFITTRN